MKAVFVLFNSLNRHLLGPYGGARVPTPNFDRLAKKCVTFDKHYVGSLPCCRRDATSFRPAQLSASQLGADGAVRQRLSRPARPGRNLQPSHHRSLSLFRGWRRHIPHALRTYQFVRGQEGDRWKAMVQPHWERLREMYHKSQLSEQRRTYRMQNMINRHFIREEKDFPSVKCFEHAVEFLDRNRQSDNWLMHLELFDPHEPFTAPERFKKPYDTGWKGPIRDWPRYGRVDEMVDECEELRANYYALMAFCDHQLGILLDYFDQHAMWKDTALILTTDHGFLLGEHDFWAKNRMNLYEEIVHIPFFAHDPRRPQGGVRVGELTQAIDVAPTLLELFGAPVPREMEGHNLLPLKGPVPRRYAAIFGYFGGAVNVTDGNYSYHRFPADLRSQEVYQYTVMPTHIYSLFSPEELAGASLAEPFQFTKGARLLKVPVIARSPMYNNYGPGALIESDTRLYDLSNDPGQQHPIRDAAQEKRMIALMVDLMRKNEAPPEAFRRLDIGVPAKAA